VIDPAALHMVLMVLTGWLDRRERHAIAYLIEENSIPRRAAIRLVGEKLGCSVEALRRWVRQSERDAGQRPG
jgi:transposase-like protein